MQQPAAVLLQQLQLQRRTVPEAAAWGFFGSMAGALTAAHAECSSLHTTKGKDCL
jgi:hypothetical protein